MATRYPSIAVTACLAILVGTVEGRTEGLRKVGVVRGFDRGFETNHSIVLGRVTTLVEERSAVKCTEVTSVRSPTGVVLPATVEVPVDRGPTSDKWPCGVGDLVFACIEKKGEAWVGAEVVFVSLFPNRNGACPKGDDAQEKRIRKVVEGIWAALPVKDLEERVAVWGRLLVDSGDYEKEVVAEQFHIEANGCSAKVGAAIRELGLPVVRSERETVRVRLAFDRALTRAQRVAYGASAERVNALRSMLTVSKGEEAKQVEKAIAHIRDTLIPGLLAEGQPPGEAARLDALRKAMLGEK